MSLNIVSALSSFSARMEAWPAIAFVLVLLPLLFILWKHHPGYGANPGTQLFPFLGFLPSILLNRHRIHFWSSDVLQHTPSLTVRFSVGHLVGVSTANPANMQHFLKTRFEAYPKGPGFYPYFADLLGCGIFNCDGQLWRFQRKVASYVFTSNSLKDFVMEVAEVEICERLLPALRSACERPHSVDLQALLTQFTFHTICQLAFGTDAPCSENVDDSSEGFAKALDVALGVIAWRFMTPKLIWKLKKALRIGNERELQDALLVVNGFASSIIQTRKRELQVSGNRERKDLLSRFMTLSKLEVGDLLDENHVEAKAWKGEEGEEGQITLSDSFMRGMLLSFLFAGRDAVASGIAFALWLLSTHPRVEAAVLEELNLILRQHETEANAAKLRSFSYDEVRKMNYLHAALSESMRLYPPVPFNAKYATEDDTLPDGTAVLKGYQVVYDVFATGRAERVWGKDCEEFRPERWLGKDGQFVPESPFKYPVFQAGPRMCLGKDFAFIQMKLVLASLVREFQFKVSPEYQPQLSSGVNLMMVNGLPMTVKRRHQSSL